MAKKYIRSPISSKLYYVSRFFHLYPLNFEFQMRKKFKTLHYFSMPALVILLIGIFIWNYRNKYIAFYKSFKTYGSMELIINVILTLFNVSCIIVVQKSSSQWELLFKPLFKNVKNRKYIRTDYGFYFIHIIQVVWIITEMYLYWSFNGSITIPFHFSLVDKINIYMIQISALLINGFVTCMKENIILTRSRLQQEITLLTKLKAIEKNDIAAFDKFTSVSELDDILNFIVEILQGIDAFNNIYGIQILGLSGVLTMFITDMFNSLFVFMSYNMFLVGPTVIKSYFSVALSIYGVLVVAPCFEATKKFDEVTKVTCKLLIELPHGLEHPKYKILREKLILLVKQLEFRKPYFSAAGFYEVNYGMFMYIFGGVTSFVVVYLQLQLKI